MSKYWLGVVSKTHVKKGIAGSFAQVCHGKKGPLSRMMPGDWLIYYSPGLQMGDSDLRAFTAIGKIIDNNIYQFKMAPEFIPFRRDVKYLKAKDVPLSEIKNQLELCQAKSWGMQLRRGLFEISKHDFELISLAMEIKKS